MTETISAADVIIAFFGLIIIALQTHYGRKHNRLSVMPHLCSDNHAFHTDKSKGTAFVVTNKGIGPAIVVSFDVYYKGEKINGTEDAVKAKVNEVIQSLHVGAGINHIQYVYEDYALAPNEKLMLLAVGCDPKFHDKLKEALKDLDICIRYRSVYDERATLDTRVKASNFESSN